MVRPYTYSHSQSQTSYTHYGQMLAHPLGSNFEELVGIIRYQPLKKMFLSSKAIYANIGLDSLASNWGQNVLLPYTSREQEYNNRIGQGVMTNLYYLDFNLSYMLRHNFFVDLKQVFRKETSAIPDFSKETYYVSVAFRWNVAARNHEF